MPNNDLMIWSATCPECLTNFAAWPHPDLAKPIPNPEDWDDIHECPVCESLISWEFGDPMTDHIRTGYPPAEA